METRHKIPAPKEYSDTVEVLNMKVAVVPPEGYGRTVEINNYKLTAKELKDLIMVAEKLGCRVRFVKEDNNKRK